MNLKNISWVSTITVVGYHLFLLVAIPWYVISFGWPSLSIWMWTFITFFLTGMAITAGYHRYYSHKAFEVHPAVEFFLLFFGTMNLQNSVLSWAHDHRLHHAHVDHDKDPYNVKKGFWYAHILWIFQKPVNEFNPAIVSDLLLKKMLVFQDRHYVLLFILTNLIVCLPIGYFLGDFAAAIIFVWWFRVFVVNHFTWFINSLAHYWGEQTYSKEHSAMDNFIMAFLTFGEGYHNYHHTFAADYRNGIKWYNFDPSKWMVWTLSKMGLAWNLRRMDSYLVKQKLITEDKLLLLEKISSIGTSGKEYLEKFVHEMYQSLTSKIAALHDLVVRYRASKREKAKETIKALRLEIKKQKKLMYQDFKVWCQLCAMIVRLVPQREHAH